jgi:cytochrome c oxidase assembly protein subunit 15
MNPSATNVPINLWPNRLAKCLAAVSFPLIWVGGLVTTSDAGMAVPDWPNTYNYNMLAYPIRDWFLGPWDLFVEHGHRLLGMLSGLVAIALCAVTWACDSRAWSRGWAAFVLGLVVGQGILGGQRVVHDARALAMIHGCVGPAFFATVVAMIVFTSRWWHDRRGAIADERRWSARVEIAAAVFLLVVSYFQLVVGANMRHVPDDASPSVFAILLVAHLITAAAVLLAVMVCWYASRAANWRSSGIRMSARWLVCLVVFQLAAGVATYVVKFGWPAWLGQYRFAASFVVPEKTFEQVNLVTLHVALGSLILASATYHLVRVSRAIHLRRSEATSKDTASLAC